MLLSTAIPIVIAAIVIVIISKGIRINPIKPKIIAAARRFGIIHIIARLSERNKIISIKAIPNITTPKVRICDLNKLCSILL